MGSVNGIMFLKSWYIGARWIYKWIPSLSCFFPGNWQHPGSGFTLRMASFMCPSHRPETVGIHVQPLGAGDGNWNVPKHQLVHEASSGRASWCALSEAGWLYRWPSCLPSCIFLELWCPPSSDSGLDSDLLWPKEYVPVPSLQLKGPCTSPFNHCTVGFTFGTFLIFENKVMQGCWRMRGHVEENWCVSASSQPTLRSRANQTHHS